MWGFGEEAATSTEPAPTTTTTEPAPTNSTRHRHGGVREIIQIPVGYPGYPGYPGGYGYPSRHASDFVDYGGRAYEPPPRIIYQQSPAPMNPFGFNIPTMLASIALGYLIFRR